MFGPFSVEHSRIIDSDKHADLNAVVPLPIVLRYYNFTRSKAKDKFKV